MTTFTWSGPLFANTRALWHHSRKLNAYTRQILGAGHDTCRNTACAASLVWVYIWDPIWIPGQRNKTQPVSIPSQGQVPIAAGCARGPDVQGFGENKPTPGGLEPPVWRSWAKHFVYCTHTHEWHKTPITKSVYGVYSLTAALPLWRATELLKSTFHL